MGLTSNAAFIAAATAEQFQRQRHPIWPIVRTAARPWDSAMDLQIERPMPMPLLLVVKKESKTWANTSGSIPGPVSSTVRFAVPIQHRSAQEFTARLR